MYEKIALVMRRDYNCSDISGSEVEKYLRFGDMQYIDETEASLIDQLLDKYM